MASHMSGTCNPTILAFIWVTSCNREVTYIYKREENLPDRTNDLSRTVPRVYRNYHSILSGRDETSHTQFLSTLIGTIKKPKCSDDQRVTEEIPLFEIVVPLNPHCFVVGWL